jgi:hypothetical protein
LFGIWQYPHLQHDAAWAACYISFTESRRLQLSPEQIAAAEACGVTFQPATPAQVQRLAMQRKVFYADGRPILATRGDGFYETVGTLQRVIEEGLLQQQDLAAWHSSAAPEPPPAKAEEDSLPPTEPVPTETGHNTTAEPAARPKRLRRNLSAVTATSLWLTEDEENAPMAAPEPSRMPYVETPARNTPAQPQRPGRRWVVAGATRRGRADKHWSTRQR